MMQKSLASADGRTPAAPSVGAIGQIRVLDIRVDRIVSSNFRHVIKRYLKRVGFYALKAHHVADTDPFSMRLQVEGSVSKPLVSDQMAKLSYLCDRLAFVMNGGVVGFPPPSGADAELLRTELAKVEPRLKTVYYRRA
ncbi:MAG: hypothetical protein ABSG92_04700 [Conexivisphaerales archaeon]